MLEGQIRMLSVMSGIGDDAHVQKEGLFEELPHVLGGVDLFHFNFCVDVAMGQEIDVCVFDLE